MVVIGRVSESNYEKVYVCGGWGGVGVITVYITGSSW